MNGGTSEENSIYAGVRGILQSQDLRGALLTVLLTSVLCGPLVVFCPVLVKTVLNGDVGGFSISIAAFGLGGLLGSIALLGVDAGRDRRRISSLLARCYGVVVVLVALDPWLWGLPFLLALAGFATTVSNTSANSLLQASCVPELRGQTVSLYMLAMRGGISIGGLLTGLSVSLFGVREALMINGSLAILAQVAVGHRWLSARPADQSTIVST